MNGTPSAWEYTVLLGMEGLTQGPAEMVLNQIGGQGWELVAIDSSTSSEPRYVFKRPVPADYPSQPAFAPEPELDPEQERLLRNVSIAEALMILPEEKRDQLLNAVLTEDERQSPTPPEDFYDRVQRYLAEQREEAQ